MDLKDIKAIIDLMKKNSITEFELEQENSKLRLKRGLNGPQGTAAEDVVPISPLPLTVSNIASTPVVSVAPPANTGEIDIKSPMIGTFYRSPSPEAAPYVDAGAPVGPETVVCIIEAMKVMNEIKAEVKGVITQCLVENGKPVEFGQPLYKVRPA